MSALQLLLSAIVMVSMVMYRTSAASYKAPWDYIEDRDETDVDLLKDFDDETNFLEFLEDFGKIQEDQNQLDMDDGDLKDIANFLEEVRNAEGDVSNAQDLQLSSGFCSCKANPCVCCVKIKLGPVRPKVCVSATYDKNNKKIKLKVKVSGATLINASIKMENGFTVKGKKSFRILGFKVTLTAGIVVSEASGDSLCLRMTGKAKVGAIGVSVNQKIACLSFPSKNENETSDILEIMKIFRLSRLARNTALE